MLIRANDQSDFGHDSYCCWVNFKTGLSYDDINKKKRFHNHYNNKTSLHLNLPPNIMRRLSQAFMFNDVNYVKNGSFMELHAHKPFSCDLISHSHGLIMSVKYVS